MVKLIEVTLQSPSVTRSPDGSPTPKAGSPMLHFSFTHPWRLPESVPNV